MWRPVLSQMEVANRSGLKYYTFVSQIENGYGRVPSSSMADWARALGVRPRSLLGITARRYIGCCSRSGGHDVVFGCGPTVAINAVNASKGHSGNPASRRP